LYSHLRLVSPLVFEPAVPSEEPDEIGQVKLDKIQVYIWPFPNSQYSVKISLTLYVPSQLIDRSVYWTQP
jgi:hypothetical protein